MNDTVIEKSKRGAKNKYENGYKAHYKEIKYNLNYYYNNKVRIQCDICGKECNNQKIAEHKKSKKCLKIFNEKKCIVI
jgi:hypothetical protein